VQKRDIPIYTTERPAKLMMNEFPGLGIIIDNQKAACSEVVGDVSEALVRVRNSP